MKYQDLIDKLLPFANEEISMTVFTANKSGNKATDEVNFYHSLEDNNDRILCVKQTWNKATFENVTEAKITTDY